MARRRRGRDIDGWLLLDKPEGVGSTDAVSRARRVLDARKAGHAGTLDPLASGLLAIAFGEATKTVPIVQEGRKTYRFTIRLGQATTTDDREGAVIEAREVRPETAEIAAALEAFRGEILQVPPAFSAVKVDGARAYDVAREGGEVALAPRPLTVHRLELVARPDLDHVELEMVCGKGGYVRSIGRDLGRALGCLGHVSALRRLASGNFAVTDALTWGALEGIGPEALRPVSAGLADLPEIAVPAAVAARIGSGQGVAVAQGPLGIHDGTTAWASLEGAAVAIGTVSGNRFRPTRVIVGEKPAQEAGISPQGEA